MTRYYARSSRGDRVKCLRPAVRGSNISMVGAVRLSGMCGLYPFDGAIDGDMFLDFLKTHLLKNLNPGDVLVMDNLRVHHIAPVRQMVEKAGMQLLYLPPYSPELNPIEEVWSVIKSVFRRLEARNLPQFVDALYSAKETITTQKIEGIFRHAGYAHS